MMLYVSIVHIVQLAVTDSLVTGVIDWLVIC